MVVELEAPTLNGMAPAPIVDVRCNEDPITGAALVVTALDSKFIAESPTVTVRAARTVPVDLLKPLVNLKPTSAIYVALSKAPELPASPIWHNCCEASSASSSTDSNNRLATLISAVRQRGNASVLGPISDDELANKSLDELGFDSLARLQLSATIRKLAPSLRSLTGNELVGHLPLNEIATGRFTPSRPLGSHRPKWLALHGFRTNSDLFAQQLAGLGDFLDIDLIFINAPHEAHGPGYGRSTGALDGYEWWWKGDSEDVSYETGWIGTEGLLSSQEFLREQVQRVRPSGVVGFSQGGGMAYWMLCEGLVNTAVLFSPVSPAVAQTKRLMDSSNVVVVRSSRADEASMVFCDDIIDEDLILIHEEGHAVPKCSEEKYKSLYDSMKQRLELSSDAVRGV